MNNLVKILIFFKNRGSREMSQVLRALAALSENLSSVSCNHMVDHNDLK